MAVTQSDNNNNNTLRHLSQERRLDGVPRASPLPLAAGTHEGPPPNLVGVTAPGDAARRVTLGQDGGTAVKVSPATGTGGCRGPCSPSPKMAVWVSAGSRLRHGNGGRWRGP